MAPAIWIASLPFGFVNCCYAPRIFALGLTIKSGVKFDNSCPRDQIEGKEVAEKDDQGYTRRAYAAQQNGWESMTLWSCAVLVARLTRVDEVHINSMALVWMGARLLYNPVYIANKTHALGYVRSAIYTIGTGAAFNLFWMAYKNKITS